MLRTLGTTENYIIILLGGELPSNIRRTLRKQERRILLTSQAMLFPNWCLVFYVAAYLAGWSMRTV